MALEPNGPPPVLPSGECTLRSLLEERAAAIPSSPAIGAPGREWLTYDALWQHVAKMEGALRSAGVGPQDRVALVLPSGPELAVAWLAVSAHATSASLNPAYTAAEFAAYFRRINPRVLLIEAGFAPAARAAAQAQGLPIIELAPAIENAAGLFTLAGDSGVSTAAGQRPEPDHVATVLFTSGTTAAPKMIPLTHRNLLAEAGVIAAAHALTPLDRVVNIMPPFHVVGLKMILVSLIAGSSIVCTPGFDPERLGDWLEEFQPTWHSGVPAMHQTLLEGTKRNSKIVARHRLRFIKSGAASLPPGLRAELEAVFGVPVVEVYGTTESGSLACTPLPPQATKPGSVGRPPPGARVAIVDAAGTVLPAGEVGEIVARGPCVFAGYENDPDANAAAFIDGWFRTGDRGYLDSDGYLFLTGRLKDQINQGGEKIAPREVDEAFLEHPAVAQAVTFPLPHPELGEVVAAAVVLLEGAGADENELRRFVAERLAPFKVPSVIKLVSAIPTGSTGKPNVRGLAEALGLIACIPAANHCGEHAFFAPDNETEPTLHQLWAEVLDLPRDAIGNEDRFLALGGNSMLALRLAVRLEEVMGVRVPLSRFFLASTISKQSKLLADLDPARGDKSLVPIRTSGTRPPLFCVHDAFGDVLFYENLAGALGPEQPVYGLQARGLDGRQPPQARVEEMASTYIEEIRALQPEGPYHLLGTSAGGSVAYEMAQQLRLAGQPVGLLALVDHLAPGTRPRVTWSLQYAARFLDNIAGNIPYWLRGGSCLGPRDIPPYLRRHVRSVAITLTRLASGSGWRGPEELDGMEEIAGQAYLAIMPDHRRQVLQAQRRALLNYRPRPYAGPLLLFRARRQPLLSAHDPTLGWDNLVQAGLTVVTVQGNHRLFGGRSGAKMIAAHLAARIARP